MFLEVYPQVLGVSTHKACSTCGKAKPKHEFSRSRATKDGLHSVCKECDHARRRARYAAHADEELQKKREYYAEHHEIILAYQRGDRAANPEKYRARDRKRDRGRINERKRGYYAADPEKHRRQAAESQTRCSERVCAYRKKYYVEHREKLKEYMTAYRAEWQQTDRGKKVMRTSKLRYRARKQSLPDLFTSADWQCALDYFGGCCAVCGRPPGLWHTLAADHWIPLSKGGPTTPDNIVPLCHGAGGCNNSKCNRDATEWLTETFGKRKGRAIQKRVDEFLNSR